MNTEELERLRGYLNENDRFCRVNGIRITKLEEGLAEGELEVGENHLNGLGIVQGGALYTLADFTFAGAVNSFGVQGISMSSSTAYLRPGTGKRIFAKARLVNKSRRTAVFDVDVFNEQGKILQHNTITGFLFEDRPVADLWKK